MNGEDLTSFSVHRGGRVESDGGDSIPLLFSADDIGIVEAAALFECFCCFFADDAAAPPPPLTTIGGGIIVLRCCCPPCRVIIF